MSDTTNIIWTLLIWGIVIGIGKLIPFTSNERIEYYLIIVLLYVIHNNHILRNY